MTKEKAGRSLFTHYFHAMYEVATNHCKRLRLMAMCRQILLDVTLEKKEV